MEIKNGKNYIIAFLLVLSVAAIGWIVVTRMYSVNQLAVGENYDLISEDVAWLNVDEFEKKQGELRIVYLDMKKPLLDFLNNSEIKGSYSLYFQDLTTGAWIGFDEKTQMLPASLLKIPTMIAILKKVQDGEMTLDDEITLTKDGLNSAYGDLYKKGAGAQVKVRDLVEALIEQSDNTALWALDKQLSDDEYNEARLALGLPHWTQGEPTLLSARAISRMFKALYLSTYLDRDFSQLALALLSNTNYDTWLVTGVRDAGGKDVKIAHKHGAYVDGGYFHDCGIVYAPKTPYVICIMSHDSTKEEADKVIPKISEITYEFISAQPAKE